MERRDFIALLGLAASLAPSPGYADPARVVDALGPSSARGSDTMAYRISGTWGFASSINTRRDGSTFDRWGENPKGIFMFDRGGRFAQIIVGSESRVFGAKVFCSFGTYSINEGKKELITRVEACSVAKFTGTEQTRTIMMLTADQFKYSNPITTNGSTAEVLWKRLT